MCLLLFIDIIVFLLANKCVFAVFFLSFSPFLSFSGWKCVPGEVSFLVAIQILRLICRGNGIWEKMFANDRTLDFVRTIGILPFLHILRVFDDYWDEANI